MTAACLLSLLLVVTADEVSFDGAFWDHWGDGQAELSGYETKVSRYGELRPGTAVMIFVTETFSDEARVKADPGRHPKSDEFPVVKLNLVQDFPTGVYDYNVMTSVFVSAIGRQGRPAGSPTKISFTGQEWCGHVYQQLLFDRRGIRSQLHSYFDGEADRTESMAYPENGFSEDVLWHWARGLAAPRVAPGEKTKVPFLPSLSYARFRHQPLSWSNVTLERSDSVVSKKVPGGTFDVRECTASSGSRRWTFWVEDAAPHRIIAWSTHLGESGALVGSDRFKYWEMNRPGFGEALKRIGMKPRPGRTQ